MGGGTEVSILLANLIEAAISIAGTFMLVAAIYVGLYGIKGKRK